ncbi:hypothetical protein scyTo_0001058 [Scyliorhinus torazame]|uniref:Uncharacterized protein n=1 Tax=Scyliorhinus torazame TaxID=75743 RepID=A0A401P8L2_SCYTO|nr:hypothetical protein [Scyliorhinus torazame]
MPRTLQAGANKAKMGQEMATGLVSLKLNYVVDGIELQDLLIGTEFNLAKALFSKQCLCVDDINLPSNARAKE